MRRTEQARMTRPGIDEAPTVASGQGFKESKRSESPDCRGAPHAGQAQ